MTHNEPKYEPNTATTVLSRIRSPHFKG